MRILLAEDHVLLLDGLRRMLEAEGHEVAVCTDPETLVAKAAAHPPDVVVTDVRMPPTWTDEGLRAAVRIRRTHPGLPVLVLSQYVEGSYATDLFAGDARAAGYLLKDRLGDVQEFLDALDRVAAGEVVVDPEVVAQLMVPSRAAGSLARLTPRERQVLALVAQGRSNRAVAEALYVGTPAVEKHIASIFTKLDLPPTSEDHRRVLAVLHHLQGAAGDWRRSPRTGADPAR